MDKTTEFFTENEQRLTKCLESAIIKFSQEKNIPLSSTASSSASKIKSAKQYLTVKDLLDNFDNFNQYIEVSKGQKIKIGKMLTDKVIKENIKIKKQEEGPFTVNAYENSQELQEIFKNILIKLKIIKKDTSSFNFNKKEDTFSFNFNKKERKKERRRTRRERRRTRTEKRRRTRRERRRTRRERRRRRRTRRERRRRSRYN